MKYQNNIRMIREDRGLSQEKLAAMINTTNPQISNLELGKRRLTWEWMVRIAGALECAPADLVSSPEAPSSITEKTLIEKFRQLDESQRETVLNMTHFLAEKPQQDYAPEPRSAKPKSKKDS